MRLKSAKHLRLIRQLSCLACLRTPCGEAAHVRHLTGMGIKPDDRWSVPLCHHCHMRQHRRSQKAFWDALDLNPDEIAEELYARSPNLDDMRRVLTRYLKPR